MIFINSWNEFLFSFTFTSSDQIRTYPVGLIMFRGLWNVPWGDLCAGSVVVAMPIVILVLMMKKIGLSEDCFTIDSEEGETVATLTIPFSEIHLEQLDTLTQTIVKEIDFHGNHAFDVARLLRELKIRINRPLDEPGLEQDRQLHQALVDQR